MSELFNFDRKYLRNYKFVIGTDEAGRGPGAGPVFAAAVCFLSIDKTLESKLIKLNDSKQVTPLMREKLFGIITQNSIWCVSQGSLEQIETLNILKASLLAMKQSVESVEEKLDSNNIIVLVDGNQKIPQINCSQEIIIKGDAKSASIAAASIIAKVSRDRFMDDLHNDFPMYGWNKNKGYMTKSHLEAVDKYGLTKWHRVKFFDKHFSPNT